VSGGGCRSGLGAKAVASWVRPRAGLRRIVAAGVLAGALAFAGAAPTWARGTIAWHGCGREAPKHLQCGAIPVPLDYAHPRGRQIRLGFARLRASDRRHRVGSLIVNPGGPGGAGSQVVAAEAAGLHVWHPALHRRFDLIGMDPRGIGLSTPVRCDPAIYNRIVSFAPRTRAEFRRLTAGVRALGRSCRRRTGALIGHVDTVSVARDMERLRRGLGDGKLNFLGLSYGAEIGTLYAQRYPTRIRTMALDGVFDHGLPLTTIFSDNARAYEDTLTRFAAWCAQDTGCALHGRDALAVYDQLVARANAQPIPAPGCVNQPCRRTVSGSDIQLGAYELLLFKEPVPAFGEPGWNGLAQALARAESGDASAFAAHLAGGPRDDPFPGLPVLCDDFPTFIHGYGDFAAMRLLGRVLAPHSQGFAEAWRGVLGCLHWPVRVPDPPQRVHIRRAPPILLVNATHDPSTPYVWAQDVRSQIAGSVLLTRDGDGHTSSLLQRSATRDAIARYLITKRPPPPNTVLAN
jgi:pimeloyl-ACP methyl ester carboxylesterase